MVDLSDRAASRKEQEDLAFRYRTLTAAQQILEEQYERAIRRPKKDQLSLERLRRLRAYVGNAIAALDRRMGDPDKRSIGPPAMTRGTAGESRADTAAE